ncbi:MAG TPA: hypothetical protein VFW04_12115 [Gemmatimonadaceae bacterium]|nr:hypothetical protein [Gemmatimonadaceae bacterium]
MLDLIGTIAEVALVAILAGLFVGATSLTLRARIAAFVGVGLWLAALVAIGAVGGFGPGATGPVPAVGIALFAALAAGLIAYFRVPRFRERVLRIPMPVLIAANIGRVLGVFFLILYGVGRLPAPFAPSAGWGDVAVGVIALPLAAMAASGSVRPIWIWLWNALGMLDLITAVALGVTSQPGAPFRVFSGSAEQVTTLPWVLIPTLLVPAYFLMHLLILRKLRAPRAVSTAALAA